MRSSPPSPEPEDPAGPGSRHVALVGLMGAGKTTVGRLVADRLGRSLVDSDEQVERRTGRSVRALFAERGEAGFRSEEAATMRAVLLAGPPAVIAVAGGAVLDASTRRLLRERTWVVWLRADPAVLAARAAGAEHRPLLDGDAVAVLTRLAAERVPLYADLADAVVDVGGSGPDEACGAVLASLGALGLSPHPVGVPAPATVPREDP